jgi:hypothetical protein
MEQIVLVVVIVVVAVVVVLVTGRVLAVTTLVVMAIGTGLVKAHSSPPPPSLPLSSLRGRRAVPPRR